MTTSVWPHVIAMVLGALLLGIGAILLSAWHLVTGSQALAVIAVAGSALLTYAGVSVTSLVTSATPGTPTPNSTSTVTTTTVPKPS